jgi:hypothetical protein
LKDLYTEGTLRKHLPPEVRFVTDAYLERNFRKLELVRQSSQELLYRRRYMDFEPLMLTAMIYDFGASQRTQLLQVEEMVAAPGSPAMVFGVDVATFRHLIETLHERGFLRYETTHNLDQIRLKPPFSAFDFLSAWFQDRDVHDVSGSATEDFRE